jgi:signal transduction histidine kinase
MTDAMAIPRTAELEAEGAKLFESPTSHAALRTVESLGAILLGAGTFLGSLLVPGVAHLLGLSALEGSVACGLVVIGVIQATVAYWVSGLSRLYFWAEYADDELEAIRRREVELKGALARLRVTQEHDRIPRDLHDGVAAQLAGLVWRVRRLASDPRARPHPWSSKRSSAGCSTPSTSYATRSSHCGATR